ncbi:MAG: hypothetical protein U0599_00900 [Vicinamibacteria bacterium]
MSAVLDRLGRAMPVAAAMVFAAACGGGSAASPTATTQAASAIAESSPTYSILVVGTVTDSSSRPVAGAQVECMGGVTCKSSNAQVIEQDGPDDGVKTNAAGTYSMVVSRSGSGGRFLMNASRRATTTRSTRWPSPTRPAPPTAPAAPSP